MEKYRLPIEDICSKADKQYQLEKKLNEMTERLKEKKLEFTPYKDTGMHLVKSVDDIILYIDEQLTNLATMKSSPFIKPLIPKANQIESRMIIIEQTLDGWIECQRGWIYLEPIFSSDDIKQKLAEEKNKFDLIDSHLRNTVKIFINEPMLYEQIENERLRIEFDANNEILDQIQKSLSEYLETKRRFFPRFFFLSDEELLEILAQTKDPFTVQKHISKCFEAISQLIFDKG